MYGENRNRGFRGGGMGMSTPPVKVGDELDVTIEAVGEKGDGLAKKNGFVLFVPGVKEGQQVRIRVNKVLRKVGFAEVVGASGAKSESSEQTEETESTDEPVESSEEPAEESTEDSESFGEETEESTEEPSDSENFGDENQ